jgi:hypothetical protein
MEVAVFAGLLGLGYFTSQAGADANTKTSGRPKTKEGFTDSTARGITVGADKTPPGAPTIPGKPRTPRPAATGEYDIQFQLPASGTSIPADPYPSKVQGGPTHFPVAPATLPSQHDLAAQALLQMRPDRWEDATPRGGGFVSALSGVEFKPGEFKHANMVPFFRGQVKQNTIDTANNQVLDVFTGSGKTLYAKREQAPFFEPTKEPIGNPFGLESTTDFMESRMVEPRNRANERPMESVRVGPGLNAGFTHLPSGGYQQQAGEDYVIERMPRTNDLRTADNPKLTYDTPVVPGSHFITTSGTAETVGEVRKYAPDRFYLNENGERNFVTAVDTKPVTRSTQVLKHVTRPDTSKEYEGVAGQVEGKATYTVGSTRTPLVKQHGPWGYRNADLTANFNPDTDAPENDYGKSGVEILPNERFYTGERVHGLNLKPDQREVELPLQDVARPTRAEETIDNNWIGTAAPADVAPKLTVYDPNDVARTTIRETTEDNDYIGTAAGAANAAQKLTVYDPDDIARVTGRNTLDDWDWYRNAGRQDTPESAEVRLQDKVRNTQKAALSNNSWTGSAIASGAKAEKNRQDAYAMRQYAQKENVARGRKPLGSSVKLFNGEDFINQTYRRLFEDSVNDREPGTDRVNSEPTSADVIGAQRPRSVLKLDISAERMEPVMVASLERNPYVIPLHKAALVGGKNAI